MKKEVKKKVVNSSHPIITPIKFGQKAADKLTKAAGSWTFILIFIGFLILWMAVNLFY